LLNLGHWIVCTEVEGPGKRFALWTQGCHIRCADCCNPELLPFVPNRLVEVDDMVQLIETARQQHGIEGITLLGGEPMIQARGLSVLARDARRLGLTVMLFTGYVIGKDRSLPDGAAELLEHCDLVVDGPYVPTRQEGQRNWVGSTNQRFHYLTTVDDNSIETEARYRNGVEIRMSSAGKILFNGFPF
jgi:anaerobic ribonucleoside-triphosphate reductase activating protein